MSHRLATRRRQIRARGRTMLLARPDGPAVSLVGYLHAYGADEMTGGVQQGDGQVETLNDEIAAAEWPAPPSRPDRITIGGQRWTVQGAWPVYDGELLIGWKIWVRGNG
ncbi:hypothetical protein [Pseudoroseomonas cervicalis]|uniref:hypothetical protein n=1 Tax=Teichococcus cervicalis TaxID=204525 RepID=UPI0027829027|nr:hypothetical protein [Pseudoroseomonas cervicalis]MDQ1081443.1 hypothetical protein [Pseudoroseomonas cervicalis]